MRISKAGGRPVDTTAAPKIMNAVRTLVSQHGYTGVTMEMIADTAGVGRQTVYRRWRSKADLVLDTYLDRVEAASAVPDGSILPMLETLLKQHFAMFEPDRRALRSLIAAAQFDPPLQARLDEKFAHTVDEGVTGLLLRAVSRGELPETTDVAIVTESIHGAIWYRLLLGRPLDDAFVSRLTMSALGSLIIRPTA